MMVLAAKAFLIYALNSLWQLPLLGVVAELLARFQGRTRGRVLSAIWTTALASSLLLPCLLFLLPPVHIGSGIMQKQNAAPNLRPQASEPASSALPLQRARMAHLGFAGNSTASQTDRLFSLLPHRMLNFLVLLYCGSVVFAMLRLGWRLWQTHVLISHSEMRPPHAQLLEIWEHSRIAMKISSNVRLLHCSAIGSPATLHWPRPLVLLPIELGEHCSDGELHAAFCHELAHVKRRDFVWNMLFEVFGVLLFYHPAFHWMRHRIREARELACDDMASEPMQGRREYARSLLGLTEKMLGAAVQPAPNQALGVFEGEVLERRIMNLLNNRSKHAGLRLGISLSVGIVILLCTCALSANFGLRLANAQEASQSSHAPEGWFLAGSKPADYDTGVDQGTVNNGQPSAFLRSVAPNPQGFGTLMQTVNATDYAGKRIRLRGWVKTQDVTGSTALWMRADHDHTPVAFDNMQKRAITGTAPWKSADIVLNIPKEATSISFGILLQGGGQVWLNDVSFEPVGDEVPVTDALPQTQKLPDHPTNLKFGH